MSKGDRVFTIINAIIMILVCIVVVYPLYYVLLASVTDPVVVNSGKLLLYPEAWYTEGYVTTLEYGPLWTAYKNTIVYTVVGTVVSLICTIPAGYALSRMDLVGRKPIMFLFTFTMFFSGGMIPLYLTIQQLNIYNTIWAMVLPVAVSAYNLIVCRSFFDTSVPIELLEAAKIDGCSDFGFFFKIAIPLSKTIIAVMESGKSDGLQRRRDGNETEACGTAEILYRSRGCVPAALYLPVPSEILCEGRYHRSSQRIIKRLVFNINKYLLILLNDKKGGKENEEKMDCSAVERRNGGFRAFCVRRWRRK